MNRLRRGARFATPTRARSAGFIVATGDGVNAACSGVAWDAGRWSSRRSATTACTAHLPGTPFKLVLAARFELDARAEDQIPHRRRDQHLGRPGQRHDARPDVRRDAADVIVGDLALAGMHPRPHLHAFLAGVPGDRQRAPDRECRAVEGRKHAVAHRLDQRAVVTLDLVAHGCMVIVASSVDHRSSPISTARAVDSTMSV